MAANVKFDTNTSKNLRSHRVSLFIFLCKLLVIQLALVDLKLALGNFPLGAMYLRLLLIYRPIFDIVTAYSNKATGA